MVLKALFPRFVGWRSFSYPLPSESCFFHFSFFACHCLFFGWHILYFLSSEILYVLQVGKKVEHGSRSPSSPAGLFFQHAGHRFATAFSYYLYFSYWVLVFLCCMVKLILFEPCPLLYLNLSLCSFCPCNFISLISKFILAELCVMFVWSSDLALHLLSSMSSCLKSLTVLIFF